MSETQPEKPAAPNITFHALSDQPARVFVHLGAKVRHFTETNLDRLPVTLRNVLIAEFGLKQEHADEVAGDAIANQGASNTDHVTLLQEQLADTDRQLTEHLTANLKLSSDLSLAQSDLRDANKTIDDLRAQLAAATQPQNISELSGETGVHHPDTSPANVGETDTAGSAAVGTQPEGQTPPAQQANANG